MSDEGGEAACWLDRVCDLCGMVMDDADDPKGHRCRPRVTVERVSDERRGDRSPGRASGAS